MSDGYELLAAVAAHCQTVSLANGPIFLALLLAGLVGSASHCAGMCGPFVVVQTSVRMAALPMQGSALVHEIQRLGASLALPYQMGRGTTYIMTGAILAAPFSVAGKVAELAYLAPTLLALAAAIFAWQAWRGFGRPGAGLFGTRVAAMAGPLLQAPFGWRGYALGVLLGFLPCGLLYGALAAAAATADPLAAAIGMAGFVLGTVPSLWVVGYLGGRVAERWRPLARRAMPYVAGFNALVLLVMALRSGLQA
jgi:sulfite exporter TauE/SafE